MTLKPFLLATALAGLTSVAHAATMTAGIVTVDPNVIPTSADQDLDAQTVRVVGGNDGDFGGDQFYDADAGANGDLFNITSTSDLPGGFFTGDTVTWTVSGLMFEDNEVLTDIEFLTSFGNVVLTDLTETSFTFSYDNIAISQGTYISARYITASAVPLPASVLLLGAGMLGLGGLSRRRKHAA